MASIQDIDVLSSTQFVHVGIKSPHLNKNSDDNSNSTLLGDESTRLISLQVQTKRFNINRTWAAGTRRRICKSIISNNTTKENTPRLCTERHYRELGSTGPGGVKSNFDRLESYNYPGWMTLRRGQMVELTKKGFLKVATILQNRRTGEISLRGSQIQLALRLDNQGKFKGNGLEMVMIYDLDDPKDVIEQSIKVVDVTGIAKASLRML